MNLLFLQNIGLTGLIVIAFIALLLFGSRLPDVMRNLGKGMTSFKKGLKEGVDDDEDGDGRSAQGKAKKD